jgi:peptidoglycan hydrolase-like protein with peptidoglycan-binding domain
VTAVAPRPYRSASRPPPRRRRRRRWPAILGVVATTGIVLVVAVGAYALAWPSVRLHADPSALARVELAPVGVRLEHVAVTSDDGSVLPSTLRSHRIWPHRLVAAGTRLTVVVTVRRSGWLSWIAGRTSEVRLTAVAPAAHVAAQIVHPRAGRVVTLRFDTPVARVAFIRGGRRTERRLAEPRTIVATGIRATAADRAGALTVTAATRPWESLGAPEHVAWFPPASHVQALVQPGLSGPLAPTAQIELTLSEPLDTAFGSHRPSLTPGVPGRWIDVDDYTVVFRPSSSGFGLGGHVRLTFPQPVAVVGPKVTRTVRTLTWLVPPGKTLRLQQLLAQLGYLPLDWQPSGPPTRATAAAQIRAALAPPAGRFAWKYAKAPAQLRALWRAGDWTTLMQGAVMRFEDEHHLQVDGLVGPIVWRTLIHATLTQQRAVGGYSYVLVHRTVPQTLVLWHNGRTVLTARVNTGVPGAPTALGTFPVFLRAATTTMTGTNPDGSRYSDPGIRWVSYFHGGEAIHGFNRASYGFPQSVGCVEAPVATAGRIWPYTPIGTLVTIAS